MVENWGEQPATDKQRKLLFSLFAERGIDSKEWETQHGIEISALTKGQMSDAISELQKGEKNAGAMEEKTENTGETHAVAKPDKPTKPMVVGKAEEMAGFYGIPSNLANMFFMTIDGSLYIKSPGLLYMAGKKGYARIKTTSYYDSEKKEWGATTEVFPVIPKEVIVALSGLDKDMQKQVLETQYGPTVGYGRASAENVKSTRMHPFLKEMAETRSVNRALRLYTGYGGTSYEERPDSVMEVEQ